MGNVLNKSVIKLHCLLFILTLSGILGSPTSSFADLFSPNKENHGEAISNLNAISASVSNFSGAASTSIQVIVPPGRAGIEPKLSLAYSSSKKNGWIGVGWDIGVGSIQRATKFGLDYNANDDEDFIVNGSELVRRPEWGTDFYGAKVESGFTKYKLLGSDQGWEVTSKDGNKYYYGTISASNSKQSGPYGVFKWCLDKVVDTNGNFMTFTYTIDQGQVYLNTIEYTGNGSQTPTNSVKFHLMDRSDKTVSYLTNYAVTTAKILKAIEIKANGEMVRVYELNYNISSASSRNLLTSITQFGNDAEITFDQAGVFASVSGSSMPPIQLTHHNLTNELYEEVWNPSNWGWGNGYTWAGDFNGDGKTDMASATNGVIYVKRSTGTSFVEEVWNPYNWGWGAPGYTWTGDFNGDGLTDIASAANGIIYVKRSTGTSFVEEVWNPYNWGWGDGYAWAGDFDGDGLTDIASAANGTIYVKHSTGTSFVEKVWASNNWNWGAPGYTWVGDFNGDGLTDIASAANGIIFVKRSTGNKFVEEVWNPSAWNWGDPGYTWTGDFNGDGKTDIATAGGGIISVKVSTGTSFVEEVWNPSSWGWGYGYAWTGDFNGDGMTDLASAANGVTWVKLSTGTSFVEEVWNPSAWGWSEGYTRTGDFNGDGKTDIAAAANGIIWVKVSNPFPTDLVETISNGQGGSTSFEYLPSSEYDNTLLTYVMQTVSRITVDDGMGDPDTIQTTDYSYSGGFQHKEKREFRGFAKVTQTNANNTVIETSYLQDEYTKGRQRLVEAFEYASGPKISDTTYLWEEPAITSTLSKFVRLNNKISRFYEGVTETNFTEEALEYFPDVELPIDQQHGGVKSVTTSGTGAEPVTTTNEYINYGDWLWRNTKSTITNSLGKKVRETIYGYETGTGNLLTKEYWLDTGPNPKTIMTYYSNGNLWTITDALGNVTTTEYDTLTQTFPVKTITPNTTNCDGATISHILETVEIEYKYGKPTIIKDENGNLTTTHFDVFGRPYQIDSPNGGQQIIEYYDTEFPRYNITKVKENTAGSYIINYTFMDGQGRDIEIVAFGENNQKIVTKKYYDNMGRSYRSEGPFFSPDATINANMNPPALYPWSETIFDPKGRPSETHTPDGRHGLIVSKMSYNGLETTITDPDGGRKTEIKDYLGRLLEVIEYPDESDTNTLHTYYDYNVSGDLLTVTDAMGNQTIINYDSLGRKTNMSDPDMGYWQYVYDVGGNLKQQIDAKGQVIDFIYDEMNRLLTKTYTVAPDVPITKPVTYCYDNPAIANGIGQPYSVSNTDVTTTNDHYNKMGSPTKVSKTIVGDPVTYTTETLFDLSGKVDRIIYPDGYLLDYNYYDGTGLLQNIYSPTDFTTHAIFSLYEPTGKIGSIDYANNVNTTYTYDDESTRLTAITTSGPFGDIQDNTYLYTPTGDIEQIHDVKNNITRSYIYDYMHRLKEEISNAPSQVSRANNFVNAYDKTFPLHAPKNVDVNGTIHTYQYDANGNMTTGFDLSDPAAIGIRTIAYNAENMPVQIDHSAHGISDIVYDGGQTRAKKVTPSGSVIYYIGGHFEVKDGIVTKYLFTDSIRIAMVKPGPIDPVVNYFHKDHLGSSTAMTQADGSVVEATSYMPYGLDRTAPGMTLTNHKFTDQEQDPEAGLYNYNARLYDPSIGLFITPDTIVPGFADPQSLNRYSYVRNNPLVYSDPSGHAFVVSTIISIAVEVVTDAVVAGVVGGAIEEWSGGEFMDGFASGAISGAFSNFGFLGSIVGGGINSELSGGKFTDGMLTGALTGLVQGAYGDAWSADRILAEGAAGGLSSEIQGGEFKVGAAFAAGNAFLNFASYQARAWRQRTSPRGSVGNSPGVYGISGKYGGVGPDLRGNYDDSGLFSFGGHQNDRGRMRIFGFIEWSYDPGSFTDTLVESYAGVHDWLNGALFGMYTDGFNNGRWGTFGGNLISAINVIPAAPFGLTTLSQHYLPVHTMHDIVERNME